MTEGRIFVDITMSVDGFIAGPNDGPENPLGDGGERLHEWVYPLASWREPHGLPGAQRDLASTRVIHSPRVTHLKYDVVKGKR